MIRAPQIGTAEAARRRLRDTSLERGHGRSRGRIKLVGFPEPRERGLK
jgi:hypothetical protein